MQKAVENRKVKKQYCMKGIEIIMRKILWLCNTILPDLFTRFAVNNVKEGWLIGISKELRKQKDIEFHYACPQKKEKRIVNIKKDGIQFHCFYAVYEDMYTVRKDVSNQIEKIVNEVCPDVIHIFGTEMPHAVACVDSVKKKDTIIISIQGIVSECAKHYLDGISPRLYYTGGIYNGKYQTIFSQYRDFCKRAGNEIRAIKCVGHVIGRTDWDKACVNGINDKCTYHYCNESLRDCFYDRTWNIAEIEKYSIFVSQGNYPIKGLHNLLQVLPVVVKKFPKAKVYVAGEDSFLRDGSPYGRYIKNIIKEKKLESHIFFLGILGANQICERLLQSHVVVMPSNIENSPNSIGEAMMVGTPVIAAFVGGIPSILQHGTEGLLYQSDSVNMLAYYICELFGDKSFAEYVSENGQKHAKVLYDRENNLQRLLEIYREVGNNQGQGKSDELFTPICVSK